MTVCRGWSRVTCKTFTLACATTRSDAVLLCCCTPPYMILGAENAIFGFHLPEPRDLKDDPDTTCTSDGEPAASSFFISFFFNYYYYYYYSWRLVSAQESHVLTSLALLHHSRFLVSTEANKANEVIRDFWAAARIWC